ncbi:hypothetical protein BJY01DRAFT_150357 [Aspergillus pseudoustus]|uniref:Zn(2)-C6 fungal-type domain-containing protein n=1 Tax=Aspergillus pseudoustus TaxID=1810923 RepID=A0ABR4IEM7_9EURO
MRSGRQASRQTIACINCRQRKRRCDGQNPCSVCCSRGWECAYSSSPDGRNSRHKQARTPRDKSSTSESAPAERSSPNRESIVISENPQFIDFSLKLNNGGELEYFGPTSSVPQNALIAAENPMITSIGELPGQALPGQRIPVIFPDIDTLKQHIDLFLEWQSSGILILAGAQIDEIILDYNPMILPPKKQVLLAAMLSLTYKFVVDECLFSHRYFLFAKQLLTSMVFSNTTVELVLAACILACQAYGCGNTNAAWIFNGISTTAGNILGLHVGADYEKWYSAGHISQAAMEIRVQAYWASVVIDRVLATCMGRHCLIHPTDFNTPPIRLKLPNSISTTPEYGTLNYERNIVATFQHSVEFWKLSDKALSEIYDFRHGLSKLNPGAASSSLVLGRVREAVTKYRREVHGWHDQLPQEIKLSRSHPVPHLLLLDMAYHNCMILIHRPFILACPCAHPSAVTEPSFSATASSKCKTHAVELMELSRIYQTHYSLRYSAFVLIHYLLNASTVLAVNCRIYEPYATDEYATLSQALQTCMAALQEISHTWAQASKALQIIHHLMNNCDLRCRRCKNAAQQDKPNLPHIPSPVAADETVASGSSSPLTAWFNTDFNLVLPPFCDDFLLYGMPLDESAGLQTQT